MECGFYLPLCGGFVFKSKQAFALLSKSNACERLQATQEANTFRGGEYLCLVIELLKQNVIKCNKYNKSVD